MESHKAFNMLVLNVLLKLVFLGEQTMLLGKNSL